MYSVQFYDIYVQLPNYAYRLLKEVNNSVFSLTDDTTQTTMGAIVGSGVGVSVVVLVALVVGIVWWRKRHVHPGTTTTNYIHCLY